MRTGIVLVASIVVSWAEEVTFATWNVLSIPKCSKKANGFPYFTDKAFKLHNKLSCGAEETVTYDASDKELVKSLDLKQCSGVWISQAVSDLFGEYKIDILVAQEIDYFHLKGLYRTGFGMTPLVYEELEEAKKILADGLTKPIPPDTPFVIWNRKTITDVRCSADPKWATGAEGVGECHSTTASGSTYRFIGMHAGGNNGFNLEAAATIGKLENIDVVLGDFNLHSVETVAAAVRRIEPELHVASGGPTVYRFVHPARKLFQAFDNNWRHGIPVGQPFKCQPFQAQTTERYLKDDEGKPMLDKKNKPIVDYEMPERYTKVFKIKPAGAKKFLAFCEALEQQLEPKDEHGTGSTKKVEDKLVEELGELKNMGLADGAINYKTDFTKFAEVLGLKDDLEMTEAAAKYVSMDVKREDFITYNKLKFREQQLLITVKEGPLEKMVARNKKLTSAHAMEHFPIEDMASDHLPVVLHLEKRLDRKKDIQNFKSKSDIAMEKKPSTEKAKAKSASIRRKLGGMAPTMGKLLKALKRVSQRMKKGERAA